MNTIKEAINILSDNDPRDKEIFKFDGLKSMNVILAIHKNLNSQCKSILGEKYRVVYRLHDEKEGEVRTCIQKNKFGIWFYQSSDGKFRKMFFSNWWFMNTTTSRGEKDTINRINQIASDIKSNIELKEMKKLRKELFRKF